MGRQPRDSPHCPCSRMRRTFLRPGFRPGKRDCMRILTLTVGSVISLLALSGQDATGQIFVGAVTNRPAIGSNVTSAVNPKSLAPNLATSNATPAIGRPGITPAMPTPGSTAITPPNAGSATAPQRGFTTGIGRQGFGGAIGQQGSGTALGQQGSGTSIGQQGTGTAIIPQNNAIVIGQPEPFSPPPVSTPSPTGLGANRPPGFVQPAPATNSASMNPRVQPAPARPTAPPAAPTVAPSGHR